MAGARRRRFGPLFYATAGVAVLLLGSQPLWEPAMQRYRAWQLTRQLGDPSEPVRREAVAELVQIGPAATWWVVRASRDPAVPVRLLCCTILGRLVSAGDGAAAEALLAATRDADASVRAAAVSQMVPIVGGIGFAEEGGLKGKALRSLGAALDDPDPNVRQTSAWALAILGPKARPAIPDLERALDGPDKALRPLVAEILLNLDLEAMRPRVIAALSKLLADTSIPNQHWRLLSVLNQAQGPEATAAMLTPLVRHADLQTRVQALNDLAGLYGGVESARSTMIEGLMKPVMIEGLTSDDGNVRGTAALFLLKHDPALAAKAIETLAEQMVDPIEGSYNSEYLLWQIRETSPDAMAPLAKSLVERLQRARKPDSRLNAIMSLGEIGPEARCAIPALLEQSRSGDLMTAMRAIEALVKIDPKSAEPRIPALLDWTTPGHKSRVRLTAMAALRDLGPAAKAAVPALLKLADEDDLAIAAGAIEAIGRIDPPLADTLKHAIERGASRPPD